MKIGARALKVVVVVLVIASAAWAYQANQGSDRSPMDMAARVSSGTTPFPVVIAAVERGAATGTVTYTGSVAPFNEEDVYPRVTGRVLEIPVYPGDAVRAGQVVARLDDVELSSRAREAEAGLVTARANRAQAEAELVGAQQKVVQMEREVAMVDAELDYARAVAARAVRLFDAGLVARQEYERERAQAATLGAKREAALATLEQARAMETAARRKLDAADALMLQSGASARTAQIVRDYVTLVAPTGGYVVKRLIAPGVLVQPGTSILKIAQIDRVRLQANVGERDLPSLKVGSPVTISPAGSGQSPTTALVTSVFPFVDPGARTAVVEAVVDNRDRLFLPGQYVRMEFVTGERADAVTVPRGAVSRLGDKATVWVVQGDRVQPRVVTTGLENADVVEITAGLSAGERVVAQGHEGLYADARVAVAGSAPPPPPSGAVGAPQRKEGGHTGH